MVPTKKSYFSWLYDPLSLYDRLSFNNGYLRQPPWLMTATVNDSLSGDHGSLLPSKGCGAAKPFCSKGLATDVA